MVGCFEDPIFLAFIAGQKKQHTSDFVCVLMMNVLLSLLGALKNRINLTATLPPSTGKRIAQHLGKQSSSNRLKRWSNRREKGFKLGITSNTKYKHNKHPVFGINFD